MILELDIPNSFSWVFLSVALLISSLSLLFKSFLVIILRFFWRYWCLIVQIYIDILFYLLLLFLIFVYLLLQLCTLSVNITEIRELLSFCFLIVIFAIVIGLSLFLIIFLLLQLHTSIIKGLRIRRSLIFSAFIIP